MCFNIFNKIKTNLIEILKDIYGHYVVLKIIENKSKKFVKKIILEIKEIISKLFLHQKAAKIIDLIYSNSNLKEKENLISLIIGPAFKIYNEI